MTITTVTRRELNQDVARAKKAVKTGPVFITDRGKPVHVLLSIEDFRAVGGEGRGLLEALSMAALADIDMNPPRAPNRKLSRRPFLMFLLRHLCCRYYQLTVQKIFFQLLGFLKRFGSDRAPNSRSASGPLRALLSNPPESV